MKEMLHGFPGMIEMNFQNIGLLGKKLTPSFALPIARKCWSIVVNNHNRLKIKEIIRYYESTHTDDEIDELLLGIRNYGLRPFPYSWADQPKRIPIDIHHDDKLNLHYVYLEDKRLYYPRDMTPEQIQRYHYATQIVEQHPTSPHRYLINDFDVDDTDIVADCGVAEGNFGLSVVDKVRKLYLFEPEDRWMEPLYATFSPWEDKVEIVQTYLSDSTGGGPMSSTIDAYFSDKEYPTFLKLDVEGYESRVLIGATKCIESGEIRKIVSCVYHYADDEKIIRSFLQNHGYTVTPSRGYMVFSAYDELKPPYFRRGLLRGTK